MSVASGSELGLELCRIFGLDPDRTGRITVVAEPGDVARVIVEKPIEQVDEEDPLVRVVTSFAGLKKFRIEEGS